MLSPVSTKLLAPELPMVHVPRHRLHDVLEPMPGRRASLIVGPPGAGKTTLAREWLSTLSSETRWGWYTVDADDSDSGLVAALVAVVRAADSSLGRDAGDLLADDDPDPDQVVRALVEDVVGQASGRLVVVLDDAHLVADPLMWQPVEWLIEHQPAHLHVVLLSRIDPPLPLARWRARGQLGEVRNAQLTLRGDESSALLMKALGERATAPFCARVHSGTEGWVAGVRLSSLALEGGASADDVVARLSGVDGMLAEVLVDEVLNRQPSDVRRFLLDTSVVSTLEPGLCETLTGRTDAARLLHRLASDHLFIRPLEGHNGQYRHHQLFGELLRAELRRDDPNASVDLHRRASVWYEERGIHVPAIEHALAGGDYHRLLELVVTYREVLSQGHRGLMSRWVDAIPHEFIVADPERVIDHAVLVTYAGNPEQLRWLDGFERFIPTEAWVPRRRALRISALLDTAFGRLEAFEAKMAQLNAERITEPDIDPIAERIEELRPRMLSVAGRHDDAIEAAEGFLASRRMVVRDDAVVSLLAGVLVDAGHHDRAKAMADRAIDSWNANPSAGLPTMVDGFRARAAIHRIAGEYESAAECIEQALLIVDGIRPNLLRSLTVVEAAALDVETGRADVAVRRLDHLDLELRALAAGRHLLDRVAAASGHAAQASTMLTVAPAVYRWTASPVGPQPLTERERVVLHYLASHLTVPELAHELRVSRNTIKSQAAAVYRKLGAASRSEAVQRGRQLGLIGSSNTGS